MLYTDGLIEGRVGPAGTQRLGQDGMVEMINRQLAEGLTGEDLLTAAVTEVRELNGGELTDDVAVLLLDRDEEDTSRRDEEDIRHRPEENVRHRPEERSALRSPDGDRGRSIPRPRPGSASPTAPVGAANAQRPPL